MPLAQSGWVSYFFPFFSFLSFLYVSASGPSAVHLLSALLSEALLILAAKGIHYAKFGSSVLSVLLSVFEVFSNSVAARRCFTDSSAAPVNETLL